VPARNPDLLASPEPAELGEREAHLHVLRTDALAQVSEAELLARFGELLSPEEGQRQRRYLFEHSRRQHLLTRVLVRSVLSRYAMVDPRSWRFEANPHGRPFIAAPAPAAPLAFNLAHTDGLVVCLVARSAEIGVDVEYTPRRTAFAQIAGRFFSPSEAAALCALPPDAQRERFFAYWTLKEAYIKARGIGLAIALDAFSFALEGDAISIAFDARIDDEPGAWQFTRLALSPEHACAIAQRVGSGARAQLRQFEWVPPPQH
jgi:4'-phosphopantetheinyl transferase